MARISPELRVILHEVANELDSDNVRGLKFLLGVSSGSPSHCCHCSSASRTLDLLEDLHKAGLYRQDNMSALVEALEEVGRNDLSTKCRGLATPPLLPRDSPLECTERDAPHTTSPHSSASPEPSIAPDHASAAHNHAPSFSRVSPVSPDPSDSSLSISPSPSPSPSSELSFFGSQPDSSLHMPVTRTTATPTSATPTKCWGQLMRAKEAVLQSPKQWIRRLGKGRSCESESPQSDEFVVVEHPLQATQSFDVTMSQEAQARRQRYRDNAPCNTCQRSVSRQPRAPRTDTPTFHWILQRMSFVDPIFQHQPKAFTNKFSVTGSRGRSECSLTFNLKLYPNGVNWDQDKSASLHVEISGPCGTSPSHTPSPGSSPSHAACTAYVEVVLLEVGEVLAYRRQVCRLREKREFLLDNFIPHEVIKNSQADNFKLLFNVSVSYSLGLDWVWVGDQENRGVMVEL